MNFTLGWLRLLVLAVLFLNSIIPSAQSQTVPETPAETPIELPDHNVPPQLIFTVPSSAMEVGKNLNRVVHIQIDATDANLDRMSVEVITDLPLELDRVFKDEAGLLSKVFRWPATIEDVGVHEVRFIVRDDGEPLLKTTETITLEVQLLENQPPVIDFFGTSNLIQVSTPNGQFSYVDAGDRLFIRVQLRDEEFDEFEYQIESTVEPSVSDFEDLGLRDNRVRFSLAIESEESLIGHQSISIHAIDNGIPPQSTTRILDYYIQPYREEIVFGRGVEGQFQAFFSVYENDENMHVFPNGVSTIEKPHFEENGGGEKRITYLSAGNVVQTDRSTNEKQLIVSYGPITGEARYPNVVSVYRLSNSTRFFSLQKHTFLPFPTGDRTIANYNGGELRTTVGDFLGSALNQIAVAQGHGGQQVVRFFEMTDQDRPRGWRVVKQFFGLTGEAAEENQNRGQTLAAGDLDGDGLDELVVGQTNSPTSQTRFHVIDADNSPPGTIQSRLEFTAFLAEQRGNGGIEPVVADLNGDGIYELIIASQGNSRDHNDERDDASLSLVTVLQPVVEDGKVIDFIRPTGGTFSVFTEEQNPSGSVTIAAGEMDGDAENGHELVVGINSIIPVDGFNVTAQLPPPQPMYKVIKVDLNEGIVESLSYLFGSENGKNAFDILSSGLYPAVLNDPRF